MAAALRFCAYLLGAAAVSLATFRYLDARLVRDLALRPRARRATRALLAACAALLPAAMLALLCSREAPYALSALVLWPAFLWLGALLFLLPLLAASHALRALLVRRGADPDRRRALARLAALAAGGASAALAGVAAGTALAGPRVRRVALALDKLPARARPYRIVQLSDLHVGQTLGRDFVADVVAKVNALEPDLVAITGDLVDGGVPALAPLLAPLARLRARDGVFLVTGNHEYLSGADAWEAHLPSLGVRVLRNERVAVEPAGFDLAGVDDDAGGDWLAGHGPDLARALAGRDPSRALVLLAHRPTAVAEASRAGVDVQLSGHTHGGQIEPLGALERLAHPYVAGLYAVGKTALYVSAGTGHWGPPMRLGTRSEITLVRLEPARGGTRQNTAG
jgi:predicted MPP superfamily phosphohydrolase